LGKRGKEGSLKGKKKIERVPYDQKKRGKIIKKQNSKMAAKREAELPPKRGDRPLSKEKFQKRKGGGQTRTRANLDRGCF